MWLCIIIAYNQSKPGGKITIELMPCSVAYPHDHGPKKQMQQELQTDSSCTT